MPIPKPKKDENKDDFVSRCMSAIGDEYDDKDQALAICFDAWRSKDEEKILKTLDFEIKEIGDPEDRTLEFIGSDESVDSYGDIMEVAGWDLDRYQKNPVFLWAHRYDQPPVGKAIQVMQGDKLKFHIKFASADTYPFADTIYKLYKGGFLRGTSVGFMPREHEELVNDDGARTGWRYKRQELLELSAVPVPANPNALVMAVQKGIVSPREMEDVFKAPFEDDSDVLFLGALNDRLNQAWRDLFIWDDDTADIVRDVQNWIRDLLCGGPIDDPGEWTNAPRMGSQTPGSQNDQKELLDLLDQVKAGLAEIAQGLGNIIKTFETYKMVGECTATIRRIAGEYPAIRDVNKDVYSLALDPAFEPNGDQPASENHDLAKALLTQLKDTIGG